MVNPNTMQKALAELEREGFVYSKRTSGRFVTDNKELIENERKNLVKDNVKKTLDTLINLGYTNDEILSLVEFKNVYKKYGNTDALKGIDIKIPKGKIVGLLGPNGSGKTTMIKIMNGLLTTTEGEVLINGMKPGIETKKIVAYLPERTSLMIG